MRASPFDTKFLQKSACTALYCVVTFANIRLELAGEGIWHHFTVGPVAHYHAAPHQENHTGGRERPPLICLVEPLTVLHPSFFCLEPLTSILSANLSLWLLALKFLHSYCDSFTPSVLLISCPLNPFLSSLLSKDWFLSTWTLGFLYVQWYNLICIRILVKSSWKCCSTKYFHQHILDDKKVLMCFFVFCHRTHDKKM